MVEHTPKGEQELKTGREVARVVTERLVKEIDALGIPAVAASAARPTAGPTTDITGHFVSIDEGNRMQPAVVGFGAGASEVRTFVQVYETTGEERRLVKDF